MQTVVWPRMFEAEFAPLHHEKSASADPKKLRELYKQFKVNPDAQPVAIRWRVHPDLGFPREPFLVYRRPWNTIPAPKQLPFPKGTYENTLIGWNNIPMIELLVFIDMSVPSAGVIQALDEHQKPIQGESVKVTGTVPVLRFHHPNICSIRVNGYAGIAEIRGLTIQEYAEADGWELIETVGLPYKENEVGYPVYDACLQGRPGYMKPGDEAALDRLLTGLSFSETPPASTPSGGPAPTWPVADGGDVLSEIRAPGCSLDLITRMLASVSPHDWFGNQKDYIEMVPTTGINHDDGSTSEEPSTFEFHTACMFLLGASADIHPSLGLGFGTIDFPVPQGYKERYLQAERAFILNYDYMVAVRYPLPYGITLRIAAFGYPAMRWPLTPDDLHSGQFGKTRGQNLDDPEREDVLIDWHRQPDIVSPHGFYIGIKESGNAPVILNSPRIFGTGFIPIIPAQRPDADAGHEKAVTYIDKNRQVPYIGSRTDQYLVVVQDVFGRCSHWGTVDHLLSPSRPEIPTISEIRFVTESALPTGRSVKASLIIDLIWEWEDRGPSTIEFAGKFFAGIDPVMAPGMQYSAGAAADPAVTLGFSAAAGGGKSELPLLTGHTGTIKILPANSDDGQAVRYRITLNGFILDFSTQSKVQYALWARATEKVNPTLWSNYSPAACTTCNDPLPAEVPPLVPDIHWASLPDATGTSRFMVHFPSVPYATGYLVYEATEVAMRYYAGLPPIAEDSPVSSRVLDLQVLPFTGPLRDTFTRLTREPLENPSIEVSLPGSASGIFAYNFSSITQENVESERSKTIFVAVPKRITPGAPVLRISKGNAEGEVIVNTEAGAGPLPVSLELFRTRSSLLSTDVNKMGPPVTQKTDPAWTRYDKDMIPVSSPATGSYFFRLTDHVKPGWYSHYYRAVAWGVDDPASGIHSGRSMASAPMEILIPPADPPDLQPLKVDESTDRSLWKISFRSHAEWRLPPVGAHLLSVMTIDRNATKVEYHPQIDKLKLSDIEELTGSPAEVSGKIYRHDRDAEGRWLYEVYFQKSTDTQVAVVLTDPYERKSMVKAELVAPKVPPDLSGVWFKRSMIFWLTIGFKSSVPVTPPTPAGEAFSVATFDAGKVPWLLFNRARIHQIGTTGGLGKFKRTAHPDFSGRYSYQITRCVWFRKVWKVAVRISSSSGLQTSITS